MKRKKKSKDDGNITCRHLSGFTENGESIMYFMLIFIFQLVCVVNEKLSGVNQQRACGYCFFLIHIVNKIKNIIMEYFMNMLGTIIFSNNWEICN